MTRCLTFWMVNLSVDLDSFKRILSALVFFSNFIYFSFIPIYFRAMRNWQTNVSFFLSSFLFGAFFLVCLFSRHRYLKYSSPSSSHLSSQLWSRCEKHIAGIAASRHFSLHSHRAIPIFSLFRDKGGRRSTEATSVCVCLSPDER